MPLVIREAILKDFEIIYSFICQLEETNFNRPAFKKIFLKNLRANNIFYLVAEGVGRGPLFEKAIVGFVSLYLQPQLHHCSMVAEVMELFVEKNSRSRHVGSELIRAAKNTAMKNNCSLIEVTTNRKRKRAQNFYQKEKFAKSHFKFTMKLE